MRRSKFTVSQVIDALKRVDAGLAVRELCLEPRVAILVKKGRLPIAVFANKSL